VPLIAIIAFFGYQTTLVLPRLALVPGYSLREQRGEQLTNEMMRGNLVIYAFPETSCKPAASCPDILQLLKEVEQGQNAAQASDIPLHFVTVSSDPESSLALHSHAQAAGATGVQWHFVSGDPDHFRNILQAESQIKGAASDAVPLFALVDGWGIVRALYTTPDLSRLKHDLRLVEQEARNSSGVNRYAYEAVHLFMCHNDLNATTYSQP
jgi:cytochrome oxidase Cu insertion factor (SCO1/SenC/PrrC family)